MQPLQRFTRWLAASLSPSPLPESSEGIEGKLSEDSQRNEETPASTVSGTPHISSEVVCPQGCCKSTSAAERPQNTHTKRAKVWSDEQVQQNAAVLAEMGIKTRDFAYESKLPPIRSVPYVPVQVVRPRASPLKRKREVDEGPWEEYEGKTYYFDTENGGTTVGLRPRKKPKLVERTPTEPADVEEPPLAGPSSRPVRTYGVADLSPFLGRRRPQFPNSAQPSTPPRRLPPPTSAPHAGPSQTAGDASPSQGESQGTSQDTDAWIPTPLVTPQGSLHHGVEVEDSSALPASQLDTPSRLPVPEAMSLSQLGFSPDRSPGSDATYRGSSPSPIRALTYSPTSGTPSGSSQPPPSPSPARRRRAPAAATARGSTRKTRQRDVPEPAPATRSPRYNLRERTAPVRGMANAKARVARAMSSHQEPVGKGASSPTKGKASLSSPSKRAPKVSPPKRTTRKTAKQTVLA
ncbi:uncharacterized protein C8Q71DRAFT_712116 [Rhodofomes roseus]|uniref:Uncharacterized protein n=1 Tax=Rhodofomes roseus TaxID=34475 RepID=A0ABQ8K949_9APHY|nr:uncharacterized protein C8Q71DRAFT_712116 [Rhodofomes roseus]KAH9833729.1 hypothetical protein C8Q71DRAFT_712116 [Rhodofomes roseus]